METSSERIKRFRRYHELPKSQKTQAIKDLKANADKLSKELAEFEKTVSLKQELIFSAQKFVKRL
jgi:hypothetical protein